ncbi:NADH-quinone oxidoreductase subunit G [Buchnera aphidicola (Eriosoma grossulariae)]
MIIFIDGKKYNVDDFNKLDNLLHVFLSLGIDIPYFCWHPELGSVGSCRQCAIKIYDSLDDQKGRIIMSCMTPVQDGLILSMKDDESILFRKSILELLMTNHPHDCPVCEEGGHCHLQDMTVLNNHFIRRYRFNKRTHFNQYLGPFLSHNMNRCISCYRCVRYYKDYADGQDFGVYGVSSNLYFGRIESGVLENNFSGNLVEICPTGVFTDKSHSGNYSRKWDMQYAPSICQHCSIGCNISAAERYGVLRKIDNRFHEKINNYFICDRGRFSYGYSNLKDRPKKIQQIKNKINISSNITIETVIKEIINMIDNSSRVIGIGSSRASIESNYALQKLVGSKNFSNGMTKLENDCVQLSLKILNSGEIHSPSLKEIENYDSIIILGEDVNEVAPMVALSIRQAVKKYATQVALSKGINKWNSLGIYNVENKNKHPLFITSADKSALNDIAEYNYIAPIIDQSRLGFAIAHELDSQSLKVDNLDDSVLKLVKHIVQILLDSKKPLIISGCNSGSVSLIQAAFNIAKALHNRGLNVGLSLLSSNVNSFGVGLLSKISIDTLLDQCSSNENNTMIVLEHDLYRTLLSNQVDYFLKYINCIVIDHQNTKLFKNGCISLPTSNFFESSGTVINYELRSQRFFQVYDPTFNQPDVIVLESWKWLHFIKCKLYNQSIQWFSLDNVIDDCILDFEFLKNIKNAAPDASFRINGQKIARSPHRCSGRTAVFSNQNIHELSQPNDHNTMFSFSMEGSDQLNQSSEYIPFNWSPGWNSVQSSYKSVHVKYDLNQFSNIDVFVFKSNIEKKIDFFTRIPISFVPYSHWIVVPYYFILGSDELSQKSEVIKNHIPEFYAVLNFKYAIELNLKQGDKIKFYFKKEIFVFLVHFSDFLNHGQIGIPIGTPNVPLCLLGQEINKLQKDTI